MECRTAHADGHDIQYFNVREVENHNLSGEQIRNHDLASHDEYGRLNYGGISGYLQPQGDKIFEDEDHFLQKAIVEKETGKSSKMTYGPECAEMAEKKHETVFGNSHVGNAKKLIMSNHSGDEVAENEHHTIMENEIAQSSLEGRREYNFKLTPFNSERTNINFSKCSVVFRNDLQKMKLTNESELGEARSSYDQIVVDGERGDTNEKYEVPYTDECVFVTHDNDSRVEKGCRNENVEEGNSLNCKSTDYGVDNKKMLDCYFEKDVKETKEVASVEIKTQENDVYGKDRYDAINKKDKHKREISRKELNEILQKQEERKKDEDYYEIGNFDRLIEEILDGGIGNVDDTEDLSDTEKCLPGSSLYEIPNEESFTGQEENNGFTNGTKLGETCDNATEDNKSKLVDEQQHIGKNNYVKVNEKFGNKVARPKKSVGITSRKLHVENVDRENFDDRFGLPVVKIHAFDDRTTKRTTHEAFDEDNANDVNKDIIRGKEMYNDVAAEVYDRHQDKEDDVVRTDIGFQSEEYNDLYDKNHKKDGAFEYMSSVESLPGKAVPANMQINYSSSFTQSSTLQHDSGATTSLEQSSGDRKSPNQAMTDLDATCSGYMSSPEPSLQEDAFLGSIDFMGFTKGEILSQTNNSSLTMPLADHENLELISKMAETNTSTEHKIGYISEADFDTSFSDNLSYVEQELPERDITEGIDKIENDDFDGSKSQNVSILNDIVPNKDLSAGRELFQQETNTEFGRSYPNYSDLDVLECGKESLRHEGEISDNGNEEIDHSVISRKKKFTDSGILGTNIAVNGTQLTTSVTDRTHSLANAKSTIQETKLHEIRSPQKSSHQIMFGDVEVVAITPGKEIISDRNSCDGGTSEIENGMEIRNLEQQDYLEHYNDSPSCLERDIHSENGTKIRSDNQKNVLKYMKTNVQRLEATVKDDFVPHSDDASSATNEKKRVAKNISIKKLMTESALCDDFPPCGSNVARETKGFQSNEGNQIQGENSIERVIPKDHAGNVQRQESALEDDILPCRSDASSEKDFQLNEEIEIQGRNSLKGLTTKDEGRNARRQEVALEDDFLRCNSGASSETKDLQLNEENEIEEKNSIERLITKDEGRNAGRKEAALEDDFLRCNSDTSSETKNLQLNGENEIKEKNSVKKLITKDEGRNARRKEAALEDDFLPCISVASSETKNYHFNKGIAIGRKVSINRMIMEDEKSCIQQKQGAFEEDFPFCGEPPSSTTSSDCSSTADLDVEKFQFDRQIPFDGNKHEDEVKIAQHPNVSLEDRPNDKDEMKQPYQDMIQDPDYQLNTLSEIRYEIILVCENDLSLYIHRILWRIQNNATFN